MAGNLKSQLFSGVFYTALAKYSGVVISLVVAGVLARLLSFNNVIVTSHQAFFTREALENIATTTLQNIKDFKSGKVSENEVKIQN